MIKITKLSQSFQLGSQVIEVLHELDLEIQEGEFVSLVGESGSGKSTLLHLIAGLIKPTQGHIFIDNNDLKQCNDRQISHLRNEKIGFIFQDFHLLNHLTLQENISLPYLIKNKFKNHLPELPIKISQLLKEVGLHHRATHKPSQVSGGQKQRTAIARALINHPTILLADEPTGNLDAATAQQIIELIKKIHHERKMTIIVATHDKTIASYTDRVIEIENGKIVKKTHWHKLTD